MASGDSIDTIEVVESSFMKNNSDDRTRIKYGDGDDEGRLIFYFQNIRLSLWRR